MFEIKTPLLKRIANEFLGVIDGVKDKSLEAVEADKIIRAGNGARGAVETELKVRLAAPRLEKIETGPARAAA